MMVNCPVCGKLTCIHWPEHWVYKRGKTYYCSEQCLDVSVVRDTKTLTELHRRRKELVAMANGRRYIKPEERDEALELYKDSGKQAAVDYLTKIGIPNPEKCLKNLLARFKDTAPAATVKVDGPIRIETKEPEKVEIVESPEQDNDYLFTTAAVRNKRLGTFYYDDKHRTIDWRHPCGDEIDIFADDYKLLWQALPEILRSLGVEL